MCSEGVSFVSCSFFLRSIALGMGYIWSQYDTVQIRIRYEYGTNEIRIQYD